MRDIGGLSIDSAKVITYTLSVYITVECPFNFDDFPMDKQVKIDDLNISMKKAHHC